MTAFTNEGIQALRNERKAKAEELTALMQSTGNEMTAEENAKYEAVSKDMLSIDDKIAKMEQAIELVGREATVVNSQVIDVAQPSAFPVLDANRAPNFQAVAIHPNVETKGGVTDGMENAIHLGTERIIRNSDVQISRDEARSIAKKEMRVFDKALRRFQLNQDEFRIWNAMSVMTDNQGGFSVPDGFGDYIVELRKNVSGVRENATVNLYSTSRDIPWVTSDQTAMEALPTVELASVGEQTPTIGQKTMRFDRWATKFIDVSEQLVRDSEFDLVAWLAGTFARAMGRGQNKGFTQGSTINNVNVEGYVETVQSALTTTGAAGQTASVTLPDLINVQYKLDEAYEQNAKWYMNRATLGFILGLKDSQNRPLYQGTFTSGMPLTLLGSEVVQNASMDTMAANKLSIAYGDMREAYTIGDVAGTLRFRTIDRDQAYILKGVVGFLLEQFTAGITLQPNALSYYKNSAS